MVDSNQHDSVKESNHFYRNEDRRKNQTESSGTISPLFTGNEAILGAVFHTFIFQLPPTKGIYVQSVRKRTGHKKER